MIRRLIRDTAAASAAEFGLVLPLLVILLLGVVDAGRYMWTCNRAEKATQMGVRYAVVTDMVPNTLAATDFTLAANGGTGGGNPVPQSAFGGTQCTSSGCSPNTWGFSSSRFTAIADRMRFFYPEIPNGKVQVDYTNVGLGYAGDPNGPDVAPLVTVRLTNMTFDPLVFALFGASVDLPDFRASLTLEDGAGTTSN